MPRNGLHAPDELQVLEVRGDLALAKLAGEKMLALLHTHRASELIRSELLPAEVTTRVLQ